MLSWCCNFFSNINVFALQELILDTLHYCMTIETQSALESEAMESFTKLLSHKSETIRAKAARDIMDLRYSCSREL